MRAPRKDPTLNDAIEALDYVFIRAEKDVPAAWQMLSHDEREWIDNEIGQCLDLRYYLENYHFITTENGIIKALHPFWDHQEMVYQAMLEEWAANGYCKLIVLKPRQTGISTWTAAAMFHRTITTPHCFTMLIAQNDVTSAHIYKMSLRAYDNLPWWLRPEYLYRTKSGAIEFQKQDETERMLDPGLGSAIQVSPANQVSGVAIGRTIRALHMSECSRYPNDDIWEGDIKPSMNAADTFAVIESTGYGRNGLFYDTWTAAVDGDNDFRGLFIPVYKVKKYYLPIKGAFDLSDEETTFNARIKKEEKFDIPDEFWNFRRKGMRAAKSAGSNAKKGFLESYPLTPTEAFQASGLCAFDRDSLEYQELHYVCQPNYIGEIKFVAIDRPPDTSQIVMVDENTEIPRRKTGRGGNRFFVWEMPERGEVYYVSADVALGNGGDYSVCVAWRAGKGIEPDAVVATWWGWIPPKKFAHVIAAIGQFYNTAEVACEYAKDGIATCNELRDMDYPNLYRPQFKDRLTHQASNYLHWYTNSKTRDEIIGTMNEALLDRVNVQGKTLCTVIIRDADMLDEMIDFGALDSEGRQEGQGNEDDGVMTLMIGLYCLRETLKHMKSAAVAEERNQKDGTAYVYGVYDQFMRQCGQFGVEAVAAKTAKENPGWTVRPIPVTNVNTLFSPIFDENGAERDLYNVHGLHSTQITPDVVQAYRTAMAHFSGERQVEDETWL